MYGGVHFITYVTYSLACLHILGCKRGERKLVIHILPNTIKLSMSILLQIILKFKFLNEFKDIFSL